MKKTLALLVVIAALAAGFVYIIKQPSKPSPETFDVVAGENFWGNIVSQIGGGHIAVTSIITDPGTDPHLYESDASTSLAIARAKLLIKNGLGYDTFIDKSILASPSGSRRVITVADILDAGSGTNPHIWYDIPSIPRVAHIFQVELTRLDPKDRDAFASNTKRFIDSLQPVIRTIDAIRSKYPHAPVAYTERVPEYLLKAAGLDSRTPPGFAAAIEDGNEPSPADAAAMNDLIANHRVKLLLYNAQATSPTTQHVRDLATRSGIPVVAVTETIPAGEQTYQSWQLHQAQAILRALGG